MEDRGLAVGGISRLQNPHFLFKRAVVVRLIFIILAVNLIQSTDIGQFSRGRFRIGRRNGLCLFKCLAAGSRVPVLPQTVVVRHGHAPLSHRALGIPLRDAGESLAGLFVLERVKQGDGAIEAESGRF